MNNRITLLVLSAVLIAAALSGCVQEVSEIETTGEVPQQSTAPPDAAQPAPTSEVTSFAAAPPEIVNWDYVSYRNISISNAPALNQTARVTFSIIPDRDLEALLVHVGFLDGFEFVDVEGERLLTWGKDKTPVRNLERSAKWCPTNLSKGEMYQFNITIKAVKTGNWTITGLDWENRIYVSVSEDSAYISDEPFPDPYRRGTHVLTKSEFERMQANITPPEIRSTFPSEPIIMPAKPFPANYHKIKNMTELETAITKTVLANPTRQFTYWNGTAWTTVLPLPKNMTNPLWNGTAWVEQS